MDYENLTTQTDAEVIERYNHEASARPGEVWPSGATNMFRRSADGQAKALTRLTVLITALTVANVILTALAVFA
jgi:preprotein translocase subunit SecG